MSCESSWLRLRVPDDQCPYLWWKMNACGFPKLARGSKGLLGCEVHLGLQLESVGEEGQLVQSSGIS